MSKAYPLKIKQRALELIASGVSSHDAALTAGVAYSTVRRWVKEEQLINSRRQERHLMKHLECRLADVAKEREILKGATIILARELSIK